MSKVTLKNLNKLFGKVHAVDNLNLEVEQGEFFSLLGPSGCGKTTTLRMIAGFDFPSSGRIFFDEQEVTYLKPNQRHTGMVFQNFALFPHMTVFENVAFGLQARKLAKPEIQQRVEEALSLVDLAELAERSVTELSGGQQQRVALARAIVIEPKILLLDEPLSNLDAKLREETREHIKALQTRLKITTIYVTHDQEEALNLSDRIAVMNAGVCQQVGTPEEIYKKPSNVFVADFVGNCNILPGKVIEVNQDMCRIEIDKQWSLAVQNDTTVKLSRGEEVNLGLRPEDIQILPDTEAGDNVFSGAIKRIKFSGAVIDYEVDVLGRIVFVKSFMNDFGFLPTEHGVVLLQIYPAQIHVFTN